MLVLGVVRLFQPVHGYDVRRELMSWHAQDWANAAPGSIYGALKSLTKDGSLEIVGTKAVGGRPERTTYRITARGEQELGEALRETWWQVRMLVDPMVAAVSLISFMDREEAIRALEARIALIQGNVAHAAIVIDAIDDRETPAHVREMMRLISARSVAEIAWARAFIARLRAGDYRCLGDPELGAALVRDVDRDQALADLEVGADRRRDRRAPEAAREGARAAREAAPRLTP